MNTAEQIMPTVEPSEPLPWAEICARYPDQYVCLLDVVPVERWSPAIATGRVAGHGPTRLDASALVREDVQIRRWSVLYTGEPTKPLRRPPVFFE